MRRARKAAPHTLKIEVEVTSLAELEEALNIGADVIMLDNMSLQQMAEAVRITGGRIPLEASGNVNLETVAAIAATGVDALPGAWLSRWTLLGFFFVLIVSLAVYRLFGLRPAAPALAALVLLHGATSAGREDFAAQIPLLSRAFRVYAPDARGHATTRWDVADGWKYEWLVDDVLAFADALGLSTFHLIGFSMGALTSLWFAVRHPERLRTLTVIGISPEREPRASVARHLMDAARIARAI